MSAMLTKVFGLSGAATVGVIALGGTLVLAQAATSIAPVRTAPVEQFTVNPGHRDWAKTVLAGTTKARRHGA